MKKMLEKCSAAKHMLVIKKYWKTATTCYAQKI